MFHYSRNYLSNALQLCCEDGLTKGLYNYAHAGFDDLELDLYFENVCKACLFCFNFLSLLQCCSVWTLHAVYAHVSVV